MKHIFVKHKNCQHLHCPICEGGLGLCEVCKCAEGILATDCPGFNCYKTHGDAIGKGEIDFKDGKWIKLKEKEETS